MRSRLNENLAQVTQQIAYHPEYLKEFLKTEQFLMQGDGPLRYDYRHYIAIMAAATHHCTPLINYHKQKFLSEGGNIQWLRGLQHIPQKLRSLSEINKILARSPWLLEKSHIEKVVKARESWSIGELCQILVLMAHFHCLCSFVFASEILIQMDDNPEKPNAVITDDDSYEDAQETVEELMEKMSVLQKKDKSACSERKISFELSSELVKYESDAHRFLEDAPSPNSDSDSAQRNATTEFLIQDCSWDDHAYSLLNDFYNDVGTVLDEKFKVAYDLTYYTMGHKENVDTTIFRRAVWNYIHRIYGIIHDDYDYVEMEDLLDSGFRAYVETVCFYPEKITQNSYDEIMRAFRHSEKVHVNLMLFEARLQAELLYALSAIMRYMT